MAKKAAKRKGSGRSVRVQNRPVGGSDEEENGKKGIEETGDGARDGEGADREDRKREGGVGKDMDEEEGPEAGGTEDGENENERVEGAGGAGEDDGEEEKGDGECGGRGGVGAAREARKAVCGARNALAKALALLG
ncbi:uncharacterized protein MONOS_17544 [Monocercomonoides exilis]|uniref:uncharacterized protein n=1 Tax=Monocercomonoides exilis TaxID=2049356 RepID=UPI003559CD41|nr:hypothetical protein MONOS_17544 [Monocercomonoides exilis]